MSATDKTMPQGVFDTVKRVLTAANDDPAIKKVVRDTQRAIVKEIRARGLIPPRTPALGPFLEGISSPVWRLGELYMLASVQKDETGRSWYHVSYSRKDICPTQDDSEAVRAAMFQADALVIAVYPPRDEWVCHTSGVLHLWQRLGDDRLVPDLRVKSALGATI